MHFNSIIKHISLPHVLHSYNTSSYASIRKLQVKLMSKRLTALASCGMWRALTYLNGLASIRISFRDLKFINYFLPALLADETERCRKICLPWVSTFQSCSQVALLLPRLYTQSLHSRPNELTDSRFTDYCPRPHLNQSAHHLTVGAGIL
jgi:hypothetical protein